MQAPTFAAFIPARRLGRFAPSGFVLRIRILGHFASQSVSDSRTLVIRFIMLDQMYDKIFNTYQYIVKCTVLQEIIARFCGSYLKKKKKDCKDYRSKVVVNWCKMAMTHDFDDKNKGQGLLLFASCPCGNGKETGWHSSTNCNHQWRHHTRFSYGGYQLRLPL